MLQGLAWTIRGVLLDEPRIDMSTGEITEGSGLLMNQVASGISALLFFVVYTVVGAAIIRGALDLTEGRPFELGSLFSRINIANVLVLALISGAIVFVGTVLWVIPGLVAWFLLSYATYFLVDCDLSAVDAMKASVAFVSEHVGDTLLWWIVTLVLIAVGACLCGVGLIVAVPVTLIGTAFTYKRLTGQPVAP